MDEGDEKGTGGAPGVTGEGAGPANGAEAHEDGSGEPAAPESNTAAGVTDEGVLEEIVERIEATGHELLDAIENAIATIAHREQDVAVRIRESIAGLRSHV